MNEEEMFEQLNDLINDRNSLIGSDEETNVIYKKDIQALKQVIKGYKEFNLELSGYRKAILQDKEMLGLKEQLQQKEDIIYKIKKCIEEKEEYYGDYMGNGDYTMYSMMGANNNRIPYIKSNLIKQILNDKGE